MSSNESTDRDEEDVEQLAEGDPSPRGEHRVKDDPADAGTTHPLLGYTTTPTFGADVEVLSEKSSPPERIREHWNDYYNEFALTRAPLRNFDLAVMEPGYRIRVEDSDGDRDEEMEEALKLWASNCVIHAGQMGHDLAKLLSSLPSKRRGKGTVLIEKVGTEDDPDALAGLMSLDPSTFKIYTREDQTLLIQPEDEVAPDHPKVNGQAAAFVQYDDSLSRFADKDPIPFTVDDIIKLTFDADDGEVWGTDIFVAIDDRIDALIQKLNDRDYAIRQTGYAHRIYSSQNWSQQEAEDYAEAHKKGEVSSEYGPPADQPDRGGEKDSFAGRVDFVPDEVEITTEHGKVPDLDSAVRDDIEQIFSIMPVGKYQIAYADDLNQFVVDPQIEKDNEKVDKERRYLERKISPILEEKADELASGDRYDGSVHFSIEPQQDENPLRRDGFPSENLKALMTAYRDYKEGGVDMDLPPGAFAELAGFDLEELRDRHEWDADPLEIEDSADTPSAMPAAGDGEDAGDDEGDSEDGDATDDEGDDDGDPDE